MKRLSASLRFRRRALHQQQGQIRNPGKGSIASDNQGLWAELQATGCRKSIGCAARWRRETRSPVAFLRQGGVDLGLAAPRRGGFLLPQPLQGRQGIGLGWTALLLQAPIMLLPDHDSGGLITLEEVAVATRKSISRL